MTVEILLPGSHIDSKLVRAASRSRWGELLQRGVRIYEFEPTMYHCKAMIIDGLWTSVGSANFDNRSFRLNDEANLNIIDREIAAAETAAFDRDLARSREMTYADWQRRPLWQRATDGTSALLRSQL